MAEEFPCLASIKDSVGELAGCAPLQVDWFDEDLDQTIPDKVSLPLGGGHTGTSLALKS